jgi:hypothetical protein
MCLVSVVYCQVEVCAKVWSLVQRIPTECGVSECDREASIMRRPWPTRGCCAFGNKNYKEFVCIVPHRLWQSIIFYGLYVLHTSPQYYVNEFFFS